MTLGESGVAIGLGMLGYEWVYKPVLSNLGVTPWSSTAYGTFFFIFGTILMAVAAFRKTRTKGPTA